MSIVLAGDTHGTTDIWKVKDYFDQHEGFTKKDYLIILGDAAVCGFSPENENLTRKALSELPVTTLFIDGNHENFLELNSYDADEWNGGKVHIIEDDIIHLMRVQVFNIDGKKFFTFGGAYSIDRNSRVKGLTWFPEEIPTDEEYEKGLENLEKNDFEVDYILSHTGPSEAVAYMGYGEWADEEIALRKYLQRIADNTEFTAWYFGHFHEDVKIDDIFYCLFEDMVELG